MMSISSAESVANNDDLLTDILLHLPIKSLAQFKSISTHWLSLISTNPQFSSPKPVNALLLQQSDRGHSLDLLPLDNTRSCIFPFRSLSFLDEKSLLRVSSCNGILLCYDQSIKDKVTYHVYNPTTNQHTELPPLPQVHNLCQFAAYLAFEPSISSHYKVVSLHIPSLPLCQIVIYSSETRHWRFHEVLLTTNQRNVLYLNIRKGVYWNGAIHWINRGESFRFDTREEKIKENPKLTARRWSRHSFEYFGVSWDRLHLINCQEVYHKHLDIYELERDCSRWCLKYQVEIGYELTTLYPNMVPHNTSYHFYIIPFFSQPPNIDEEPYLVLQIKTQLICYYFRTRTACKIFDLPPNIMDGRIVPLFGANQYIESLSCV